jgi:hypothetical protein
MHERIAVVLLTYGGTPARQHYARITTESLLENLRYDGPLIYHIADDGSPDEHLRQLALTFQNSAAAANLLPTLTRTHHEGYGANYNLAMGHVHAIADIIMPIEDDWELVRPLDLGPLVETLREPRYGCIRLGYLGFTDELRGTLVDTPARKMLLFDPTSPEKHVFVGHPRIETVEWQRSVGPWPVGLGPGATELAVCGRPEARRGVLWPLEVVPQLEPGELFGHIGTVASTEAE